MRVMIDSNIIISAVVFRSAKMGEVIERIADRYELCIATCCTDEVRAVMAEKFTDSNAGLDEFFEDVPYTLIETPEITGSPLFQIRDSDDYLILHTAVVSQVDIFVTGDKDFFDVKIDRPEILSPMGFLAKY
ncbi:MAG: putative toxin-antitoxin system toxin component, PIN family [Coriobacteriales bacterium]|jgi:putative PIN family toxin of toxin-antitoxin system|nr:putative toxin-antitoxin system toxin component, PIN family [Coriobacteriales bacterium]